MKKTLFVVLLVVALVAVMAAPSLAQGGGDAAITCEAHLDAFPTPSGSGNCNGEAAACVTASGQRVCGEGSFSASFSYSEGCELNEPPLTGNASGSATADITIGESGTLTTDFTWTRVGLTAVITTSNGKVNGEGNAVGAGTAAFVPILGVNNTCPEGGPLTAVVVADAVFADGG